MTAGQSFGVALTVFSVVEVYVAELNTGDYLINPTDGFVYIRTDELAGNDHFREPTLDELKAWFKVEEDVLLEPVKAKKPRVKTEIAGEAVEPVVEAVKEAVPVDDTVASL